jgi:drug/metabolite transporter (DMT)-like permease
MMEQTSGRGAGMTVHLILLAAQVCFASLAVIGRETIMRIPPGVVPVIRTAGGALAFCAIAFVMRTIPLREPAFRSQLRRDLPFLALCALLGIVMNQELFIHGLRYSGAINATVLGSTIPVFTVITALLLRKERFHWMRGVGIAMAFSGAAYLVGIAEFSLSGSHLGGSLMVLGNAASYGVYLVIVRKVKDRYDPLALIAILFVLATPMVIPVGIWEWSGMPVLNSADYMRLAFLVAVPTIGAYALVQTALKRADSTLVAAYIYLQPVFVTFGAMARLSEHPSPRVLVAAPIVFAGIFLATRAPRTSA